MQNFAVYILIPYILFASSRGVYRPLRMKHFLPVSNFSPVSNFPYFRTFSVLYFSDATGMTQNFESPPYFREIVHFPLFREIYVFFTYFTYFSFLPSLTMMHICITQCTYWMPLTSSTF